MSTGLFTWFYNVKTGEKSFIPVKEAMKIHQEYFNNIEIMGNEIELGDCNICNKEKPLNRKYYYYDIICTCCNNKDSPHFEIVWYCNECTPQPPTSIRVCVSPVK